MRREQASAQRSAAPWRSWGRSIGIRWCWPWRSLRLALPLALLVALVNPLVYAEGDTLLVRGGEMLGRRVDITLEATVAGALGGLRVVVIVVALGLMSAVVDPDELLRLFRRISYRSALTASLATRLVPVLARDATRMGEAARCRPQPPARLAVARAAIAGALDRAVDVAAALEVRGYALGGRPARRRLPWSRDRKSTRLNSSHANISYAVFCLKKKNNTLIDSTHLNYKISYKKGT